MKVGYVTIIGKPNSGKSTLLNAIFDRKLSIVSNVPGTTRVRIIGVKHLPDAQIIFIDTPGIKRAEDLLEKQMISIARDSLEGIDIILFVLDIKTGIEKEDLDIYNDYLKDKNNVIGVINKIDKHSHEEILRFIEEVSKKFPNLKEIVPVSATKKVNIDELLKTIKKYMQEGEPFYEKDTVLDMPFSLFVSEIIREKAITKTYQEVPHSIAVVVDNIREGDKNKDVLVIDARIITDRENLKHIIIGKNGSKIKSIGEEARKELEIITGKKIFLNLRVEAKERWKDKLDLIRSFGYVL